MINFNKAFYQKYVFALPFTEVKIECEIFCKKKLQNRIKSNKKCKEFVFFRANLFQKIYRYENKKIGKRSALLRIILLKNIIFHNFCVNFEKLLRFTINLCFHTT